MTPSNTPPPKKTLKKHEQRPNAAPKSPRRNRTIRKNNGRTASLETCFPRPQKLQKNDPNKKIRLSCLMLKTIWINQPSSFISCCSLRPAPCSPSSRSVTAPFSKTSTVGTTSTEYFSQSFVLSSIFIRRQDCGVF